ncbi:DNA primase [Mycoplasmoides pneumoniae]|uniref:DNA primase n=2 Tax=Mycoplasmoides pneumoniae TaxID=2104 RepID=DNAG_MYCPN|nr:DNA primase [Mycoplasmoides pneumoniae]P75426.1 RecName: Full=DNA primase [Mycoplasmoides pneumoniae M129]AAB96131.1 DNA primase [Mycoplasmoides pneumoniae M129]AGC04269.1 DNA primase [Mycoplasmoides pneumoniae M129-B7]ALA30234.1 DNA primase [Mycoplasmoides pneumoniae PI 1428]ALA32343.1 DNA primase [Mycoplasmoides pneumoniae 51494]ALA33747.1 DNA primase [Mycoplasmoides pneumoniae 54524]
MTSPTSLDQLKQQIKIAPIVEHYAIKLKKKGKDFVALCPFHADQNPSMTVSVAKNIFKCFSCQVGGDGIAFIQKIDQVDWKTALNKALSILNLDSQYAVNFYLKEVDPKLKRYWDLHSALVDYYQTRLKLEPKEQGLTYLTETRKLSPQVIERFQLGLAFTLEDQYFLPSLLNYPWISPAIEKAELCFATEKFPEALGFFNQQTHYATFKSRIMIPIHDLKGNPVGFSGRALQKTEKIKYKNSAEHQWFKKSELLFNFHRIDKNTLKLYLVEGYFDVFALTSAGIGDVVGLMGLALSESHIIAFQQQLKALETVVLALDNDTAGHDATFKLLQELNAHGIIVEVVDWNQAAYKDWDELFLAEGSDAVKAKTHRVLNLVEYLVAYFKTKGFDERITVNKVIDIIAQNQKVTADTSFSRFLCQKLQQLLQYSDVETLFTQLQQQKLKVKVNKTTTFTQRAPIYESVVGVVDNSFRNESQPVAITKEFLVENNWKETKERVFHAEIFAYVLLDKQFLVELKQSDLDELFASLQTPLFDVALFIDKARLYWAKVQEPDWAVFNSILGEQQAMFPTTFLAQIKEFFLNKSLSYDPEDYEEDLQFFRQLIVKQKELLKYFKSMVEH